MKAMPGFAIALLVPCIATCAFAQDAGSSAIQGAGSAVSGAAKQAGEKAAGQAMQGIGMMSPSPVASPQMGESPEASPTAATENSPAPAASPVQMPEAAPS